MTFKIIPLNGPPNSGKDTIADHIARIHYYSKMQFKSRLYEIGAKVLEIEVEEYVYYCSHRETKDYEGIFSERGWQGTPREHLIWVSEEVIKPLFGYDYFGKYLAEQIGVSDSCGVVISDSGFAQELMPILDRGYYTFDDIEIHVVQLTKDGCTFEGDSRTYLDKRSFVGLPSRQINPQFHNIEVEDGNLEGTIKLIEESVGGF